MKKPPVLYALRIKKGLYMRNRAKCKLCNSVIESFHSTDYVICKCGEISVDGGEALYCSAKNWHNFMRVDDKGNEILVVVKDMINDEQNREIVQNSLSKKELLNMLEDMITNIERLPEHAKITSINHYDHVAVLMLILALFKSED